MGGSMGLPPGIPTMRDRLYAEAIRVARTGEGGGKASLQLITKGLSQMREVEVAKISGMIGNAAKPQLQMPGPVNFLIRGKRKKVKRKRSRKHGKRR